MKDARNGFSEVKLKVSKLNYFGDTSHLYMDKL